MNFQVKSFAKTPLVIKWLFQSSSMLHQGMLLEYQIWSILDLPLLIQTLYASTESILTQDEAKAEV